MHTTLRRALLPASLLATIHCGGIVTSSSGDTPAPGGRTVSSPPSSGTTSGGGGCIEPVLNAPCEDDTVFCATAPTPTTDCPDDCPAGSCLMARAWDCEMGVASFSGALFCSSAVDAGGVDSSLTTVSPPVVADGGEGGVESDGPIAIPSQTVLLYIPGAPGPSKSTWIWSDNTWVDVEPTETPSTRDGAVMASDGSEVILFGGSIFPSTTLGDTWSWAQGQWTELTPATSPPARSFANAGQLGNQIVLFSGYPSGNNPSALLSDTWIWNGTTWTEAHPAMSPPARAGGSLAPLGEGGLLLFGGTDLEQNNLTDTWIWDGANWSSVSSPSSPPGSFCQGIAGLDGAVYAIEPNWDTDATDTWRFNGTAWALVTPSTTVGVEIANAGIARFVDTVLLYGGYPDGNGNPLQDHTYSWNGSAWTDVGASPGPATYANGATPCLMTNVP